HHGLEDALEVAALEGEQLVECGLALFFSLCEDHPLDDGQALLLHEHMLSAAEANTLCTKDNSTAGITRIICVGPDAELAELVSPTEQLLEVSLFLKIGVD